MWTAPNVGYGTCQIKLLMNRLSLGKSMCWVLSRLDSEMPEEELKFIFLVISTQYSDSE